MPCRLDQVRRQVGGDLEVALTPEELESMDEAALTALYQRRLAEEKSTTREVGLRGSCSMLWQHEERAALLTGKVWPPGLLLRAVSLASPPCGV